MSATNATDGLPDEAFIANAMSAVQNFMDDDRFARVMNSFVKLYSSPAQVILIEGGTAESRFQAAQYWSLLLNCPESKKSLRPCLTCPICIRFAVHMHRDCFFLDGLLGNIRIATLRDEVMPTLGEPPREARFRIVVFREAQHMTTAAANIMLKSLEEPVSDTSFLLLSPQRERLLPTLVSRSMVITLPWPRYDDEISEELIAWEADICTFIETGREIIAKTGRRGAVDLQLAQDIVHLCRRSLAIALSGEAESEGLSAVFARMPKSRQRMVDEILSVAQENLIINVNPALVIEWTLTRFFLLLPRS